MGVRRKVPDLALRAVGRALGSGEPALPPRRQSQAERPLRCHVPRGLRTWGWAVQLYALRSRASWGMGDLGDLLALARWSRSLGAGMLLLNPLHAVRPGLPQEASPYSPSSRLFRNLLYLRVEDVPGARQEPLVRELADRGRALNAAPVIDRDRIYELKLRALEALWERFPGDPAFEAYCAAQAELLDPFAVFCVLAEANPGPWQAWPRGLRHPESREVRRLARREHRRVHFHRWLQWLIDAQLRRVAGVIPLIHDLALGFDAGGADAWRWQDQVAFGARMGAPPDEFSPSGQDWGLPPLHPGRLPESNYAPIRATLRRAMQAGGGIRIDHVMGLFRLWWIPESAADASGGAYVRYPEEDMLAVLAEESRRARCYVVGEDLGTVEDRVRDDLHRRGILSYRLAWFEDRPPARYPAQALAALTTHDLPTVCGMWTGDDVREQQACDRDVNAEAEAMVRMRLQRLVGATDRDSVRDVVASAYRALGRAPSRLLAATLDDAALAPRRPNLPGAPGRPNWSIPLPRTLEQIRRDAVPRQIAAALTR